VWGASSHRGVWPSISVGHGGADATVIPRNATEILKQWTDIHGLPAKPSFEEVVDGYPRQVWVNEIGDELIESYSIPNMAHGTPLATGEADEQCGAAGPFLLEVGISSSYHIAKFFGLTKDRAHSGSIQSRAAMMGPDKPHLLAANANREPQTIERQMRGTDFRRPQEDIPAASPLDIGAVIAKALKAAGLMKGH
jgi:hypothetical protein